MKARSIRAGSNPARSRGAAIQQRHTPNLTTWLNINRYLILAKNPLGIGLERSYLNQPKRSKVKQMLCKTYLL